MQSDEIGKENNFARASRFFVHFFDVTARLKGDVTRDDTQRRFLAQHSLAMLEQRCNHSRQYCHNVTTLFCAKNRRCESTRVTSP